jgi:hypothetical protein
MVHPGSPQMCWGKDQLKKRRKPGMRVLTLYKRRGVSFPGMAELRDAHYFHEGTWYHPPLAFPCAYFDANGVFILETENQLFTGHFEVGININVLPYGSGISSLPGYRKLDPPPSAL